jgi:hypothetical protein
MSVLLLIINFGLPLIIIFKRYKRAGGVQIDHMLLFTCGFYFYWIIPIMFGMFNDDTTFFYGTAGVTRKWVVYFNDIPNHNLIMFLFFTIILYIAFALGSVISVRKKKLHIYFLNKKHIYIPLFILGLFAIYQSLPLTSLFFTGYTVNPLHRSTGPLTANTVAVLALSILFIKNVGIHLLSKLQFIKAIINPAFILFIIMCVLLLSLGSRSIFIASILIYISLYTCYNKPMRFISLLIIFTTLIFMSHVVIMFRSGIDIFNINVYSLDVVFPYLFSDSLFISFSLLDYLATHEIEYFNIPYTLFSLLSALIPSFIFPSKSEYFIDYGSLGYDFIMPQGVTSTFLSLMINFGMIGSILFLFCFSFILNWLKKQNRQPYITIYVMVCGWLGIAFFRTFEMAIIKLILEFSILVPITLTLLIDGISRFERKTNKNLS